MRRALLALLALLVTASALGVVAAALGARAADECRGLQVCLPVEGPWVVLPSPGDRSPTVSWLLRCPRRNYVVAGTDARVSHRRIDVAIRGELGSPVGPGTTTRRDVLFTARSVGAPRPSTWKPFVGCVPTSGGGGRALTSTFAVRPGEPIERRVVTVRVRPRTITTATVRCRAGGRLLEASHAIGFRTAVEPPAAVASSVAATRTVAGGVVRVRARIAGDVPVAAPVQLQLHALCGKARP